MENPPSMAMISINCICNLMRQPQEMSLRFIVNHHGSVDMTMNLDDSLMCT